MQVKKEQREKEAEAKREEERKREEEEAKDKGPQAPKGSHKVTQDVLDALDLGHNVYLVGPAGTGKSFITQQCAEILGVPYGAISCGPQTPESRLWGYMDANSNYVAPEFRSRFEFGGIFDKVWGCVAILAIGLLLVVLSYKFETVKDVMLHGMNDRRKS